ncbi:MAG: TorF family putative porin [Burkholderiales bacterium]|nr:TorF family putative porin [Burkholderiales bacterium]
MNLKSKIALAVMALTAGSAAMAQLSYNIGAVSDYRVRGITQTNYGPAVQGGVDYAHSTGFYVGAWASNVKWVKEMNGASKGDYEIDLYGGYKAEFMPGLSYDIGFITYQYPGNDSGSANGGIVADGQYSNASTKEVYAAVTYKVATLKYNQSLGDFLGNVNSNGSRYWDLSAAFDLGNGFTLTPHIGRQTIPNNFGTNGKSADYTDYALTLAKDMGKGVTLTAAYITTNADDTFYVNQSAPLGDGKMIAKAGAVVGVKYTF